MVLREICLLGDVLLLLEIGEDRRYRMAYGELVVYQDGARIIRGRRQPYRFRSVEQLRYDFEQDVKAAGGSLG